MALSPETRPRRRASWAAGSEQLDERRDGSDGDRHHRAEPQREAVLELARILLGGERLGDDGGQRLGLDLGLLLGEAGLAEPTCVREGVEGDSLRKAGGRVERDRSEYPLRVSSASAEPARSGELALALVVPLVIGCTSRSVRVAPRPPQSYRALGTVRGSACGVMLFDLIPINVNQRIERAYAQAIARAPGSTALIDTQMRDRAYTLGCILVAGHIVCTDVLGTAIQDTGAAR